jgi:hypothetical protein
MKKKYYIIILIFFLFRLDGYCQDSVFVKKNKENDNIIKIVPYGIVHNSWTIGYERFISRKSSIEILVNYKKTTNNFFLFSYNDHGGISDYLIWGYMLMADYRYYPYKSRQQRDFSHGLYFSSFYRFSRVYDKLYDLSGNLSTQNDVVSSKIGEAIGFQNVWNHLTVDVFIGPQLRIQKSGLDFRIVLPWENSESITYFGNRHSNPFFALGIRFGINFGFAF